MQQAETSLELTSLLSSLRVGDAIDLGDLVVVQLIGAPSEVDADLLEESLAKEKTEITEIGESGRVNEVRLKHLGERPLLLIDGEEIVGAKQNRMVNASFLIAPGGEVILPVSCVERGRWRPVSRRFSSPERTTGSSVRATTLRDVAASVASRGEYDSNQRAVWREVEGSLGRQRVSSRTDAYADLFAARAKAIGERAERLAPAENQVGYAAVCDDELVLIDVLGSPALFRRAWRKLARGLVVEGGAPSTSASPKEVIAGALRQAAGTPCTARATGSMGVTLHGMTKSLVIGAVANAGHVYHAVIARA